MGEAYKALPAEPLTDDLSYSLVCTPENGVEWQEMTDDNGSNLPEYTEADSGKVLTVNNDGSAIEWQILTGGSNSAQVQPDWNQSDETAPDYIKNKPFDIKVEDTLYDQDITITDEDFMGTTIDLLPLL